MDYTKLDATGEILIMVLVSFFLGYLLRYFWEKISSVDEYDHQRNFDHNHIIAEEDNFDSVNMEAPQNLPVDLPTEIAEKEDLKIIEGVGPKIEELLNSGGVENYHELANTSVEKLSEILKEGGERFKLHDPSTWPAQAELAYYGKWDELEEYQNFLSGGKELK